MKQCGLRLRLPLHRPLLVQRIRSLVYAGANSCVDGHRDVCGDRLSQLTDPGSWPQTHRPDYRAGKIDVSDS